MIFDLIVKGDQDGLVQLLKNGGVDLNETNKYGNTPLHEACDKGNPEMVKTLLKYPLNIDAKGLDKFTPLHYAVQKRNVDIVSLLLEHKADVNAKDMDGNTPLSEAVRTYLNDDAIIRILLRHGANPDIQNNYGVTVYKSLDMPRNKGIKDLFKK